MPNGDLRFISPYERNEIDAKYGHASRHDSVHASGHTSYRYHTDIECQFSLLTTQERENVHIPRIKGTNNDTDANI